MAKVVTNGYPVFTDADGQPLEEGYIYIGIEGQNPLSSPQQAYWDEDLTVPATGIRTSGGYPQYQGSPGRLYTANAFSLLVQDKFKRTIYYQPTSIDVATGSTSASTSDVAGGLPLGAVIPKNGVTFTGFLDLGTTGLNDSDYPDLAASGVDVVKDNGDGTFDLIDSGESTGWVQLADFTNADVTITHSLVKNMTDLDIQVFVSSAGTEATAIKVLDTAFGEATGSDAFYGMSLVGIGNASFKMRVGTDGLSLVNTDGTQLILTTQNWYYKVDMKRKDLPYPAQISYVSNSFTVDGGSAATQIVALRVRRDSAANWSSSNPTLALGEAGYATDTDEFKIGDGATPWNSLSVINTGATANLAGVIGTDRTFLELDGATVKVSVGSVIEANGTLYTVTGAAATPSGTAADGNYLFFDSSTGTYTWSGTAGSNDAAKGGIYDGSGRRQCRWRLTGTTTFGLVDALPSASSGVVTTGTGTPTLKCAVFPIGDWNMDADANATVDYAPISGTAIRSMQVCIRSDDEQRHYYGAPDIIDNSGALSLTIGTGYDGLIVTNTTITIERKASGQFDNALFDSTSFNRGWLTIWYEE